MAGIGFAIRRILEKESYFSTLKAYLYAGLISSGPWVLSMSSILIVSLITINQFSHHEKGLNYFLVTITYLMSSSLIFSSGLQLMLTRFIADRLYEKKIDVVLPNLMGALSITILAAAVLAAPAVYFLLPKSSAIYQLLSVMAFIVLNCLWLAVIFMSGLKAYKSMLLSMLIGYALLIALAALLTPWGINGLMAAFVTGNSVILFVFLYYIFSAYPSKHLLSFAFIKRKNIKLSLFFTGIFFYAGIWADKFLFWINPNTSQATAGMLRSSIIYDIPIFLAYLSIIPGMAVFLLRFETDFAENYTNFYDSIRNHHSLKTIMHYKSLMVEGIWSGIVNIIKVQLLTIVILLLWTKEILLWLDISQYYETLLRVHIIGVGAQVLLMAVMNVLFYLDRTYETLLLSLFFLVANLLLTGITQQLHPIFFGTGFAAAVTLSAAIGLILIYYILEHLEYETFMLRN